MKANVFNKQEDLAGFIFIKDKIYSCFFRYKVIYCFYFTLLILQPGPKLLVSKLTLDL